ncbi:MAG: peptidylprolyl isomerase [Rhodobacteraceae bacterium]|nr:peptidylprolyl isomerase [Paracoccaceae bacterium]
MFRRHFLKIIFTSFVFASFFCKPIFAENKLVIEVAGKASGKIEITLLPKFAPLHVERIKALVNAGSYDGVVFHRVIEGFMAQTGDVQFGNSKAFNPNLVGRGGSSFPNLPSEFSDLPFIEGTVGMARSQDPNSANSQFFITFKPAPHLNNKYTVFGMVSSGMEVVNNIKKGDMKKNGTVTEPDIMKKVYIEK